MYSPPRMQSSWSSREKTDMPINSSTHPASEKQKPFLNLWWYQTLRFLTTPLYNGEKHWMAATYNCAVLRPPQNLRTSRSTRWRLLKRMATTPWCSMVCHKASSMHTMGKWTTGFPGSRRPWRVRMATKESRCARHSRWFSLCDSRTTRAFQSPATCTYYRAWSIVARSSWTTRKSRK